MIIAVEPTDLVYFVAQHSTVSYEKLTSFFTAFSYFWTDTGELCLVFHKEDDWIGVLKDFQETLTDNELIKLTAFLEKDKILEVIVITLDSVDMSVFKSVFDITGFSGGFYPRQKFY